jgi:8-oxo-dGTP pyrophosphatase MutT (NUDIX family)
MSLPAPDELAQRLRGHRAPKPSEGQPTPARRSAVAAILREVDASPEVLLMTRAQHEADPWSGQVSLPGGRSEPDDPDLLATAIRETREEAGLDLATEAELLCRLTSIGARARGRVIDMDVTPYVFLVGDVAPAPGPEASELFWLPLARVVTGELDTEFRYERDGLVHKMPCWRFEERDIWGLTHRMLRGLIDVVLTSPRS